MTKKKVMNTKKAEKYLKFIDKFLEHIDEFEDEEYVPGCYMAGVVKGILIARNNFIDIYNEGQSN